MINKTASNLLLSIINNDQTNIKIYKEIKDHLSKKSFIIFIYIYLYEKSKKESYKFKCCNSKYYNIN